MEIKTKFNMGDVIHFMEKEKPVDGTIVGISTFDGQKTNGNGSYETTGSKGINITYHVRPNSEEVYYFRSVSECDSHKTQEALRAAVFPNLK